ncbi:MarR family transcriptional regulator [Nonomuraea sp. B12E4]|uniref:MarR family winged helix-turn-helix transcriptional regulator n=1 Tax=Nonomuraea sp. B12E4 TaxID=3153564 RepID=UPI00325CA1AC
MSRRRLGYLLKHANLRLGELTGPALEPYGIDGREFAVLSVLGGPGSLSQLAAAQRLGIDRTTMVALLDALEGKKLVARRPHPDDRRKNVVELTDRGRDTLEGATRAVDGAERAFLSSLPDDDARRLRELLERVV